MLREASYPPVVYFPKADVAMEHLAATSQSTHCPYKGDASYFSISLDGESAEIAGHVAFYANVVQIEQVGA